MFYDHSFIPLESLQLHLGEMDVLAFMGGLLIINERKQIRV
jgi:hypothetical protein